MIDLNNILFGVWNLFNSNFFQTIVTFVAALVAFVIYKKQQKDQKKAAANAIFLEIQHIESCLPKIKEATRRETLSGLDFRVIRDNAWEKYGNQFSSDFDKDEWGVLTDFFQNAKIINDAIMLSNDSFEDDIRQIRYNKQRMFAEITKEFLDNPPTGKPEDQLAHLNQRMELFDKLYMSRQDGFAAYTPLKYLSDTKKAISDMDRISITTIGTKFKELIK